MEGKVNYKTFEKSSTVRFGAENVQYVKALYPKPADYTGHPEIGVAAGILAKRESTRLGVAEDTNHFEHEVHRRGFGGHYEEILLIRSRYAPPDEWVLVSVAGSDDDRPLPSPAEMIELGKREAKSKEAAAETAVRKRAIEHGFLAGSFVFIASCLLVANGVFGFMEAEILLAPAPVAGFAAWIVSLYIQFGRLYSKPVEALAPA
jgi:hypothetical protein